MNQKNYTKGLQSIEIPKQECEQLVAKDVHELKSLAGQLNWIASKTRPDVSYADCHISRSLQCASKEDIKSANKYVKQSKSIQVHLQLPSLEKIRDAKLIAFSDASFANLKGGGSQ